MKTLSENNGWIRLIVPFFLIMIFGIIVFLLPNNAIIGLAALILVYAWGFYWLYKQYLNIYSVYFNENELFIIGKLKSRRIDLIEVKNIQMTSTRMRLMGVQFEECKIVFLNENQNYESVLVLISGENYSNYTILLNLIKEKMETDLGTW